jgi:urease accessory protein
MTHSTVRALRPPALLVIALLPGLAMAHSEQGVAGGLVAGLLHPVLGFDHLVAMVAVGLWGAQLRQPAIWLLPITFPMVMALGALMGIAGIPMPFVEFGIAASALVLGVMVAFSIRPPLWAAATVVGVFALFHGHAHGTEVPSAANPLSYGVGFVISTGFLHLAGILIGLLVRWPAGERVVRACGAVVAGVGVFALAAAGGVLA